ncbi:hypothetical protein SNEBB_009301 [Seison nebaliae]|nr:hypothetical protein SNEBB_009301 [Seison nebaliae]
MSSRNSRVSSAKRRRPTSSMSYQDRKVHSHWVDAIQSATDRDLNRKPISNLPKHRLPSGRAHENELIKVLKQLVVQNGKVIGKAGSMKNLSTSAKQSPRLSTTQPSHIQYKTVEEYYDEIGEMKKVISLLQQENKQLLTKNRRSEKDLVKKNNELASSLHVNGSRPVSSRLDNNSPREKLQMKQKVFLFENRIKELEKEIDLKNKEIVALGRLKKENLGLKNELYRVQLRSQSKNRKDDDLLISPTNSYDSNQEYSIPLSGGDISNHSDIVQHLNQERERLEKENQSLKEELDLATSSTNVSSNNYKSSIPLDEMNRTQLINEYKKLNEQYRSMERMNHLEKQFKNLKTVDELRQRIAFKTSHLYGTPLEKLQQMKQREQQMMDNQEYLINLLGNQESLFNQPKRSARQGLIGKNQKEEKAAKVIQRSWKNHHYNRKEIIEAEIQLSSNIQGHLTRKRFIAGQV